jgi:hypothetical protein
MAAEKLLPAITLTDPNNDPASPSPAFSPTKDTPRNIIPLPDVGGSVKDGAGRQEQPSRRQGGGMCYDIYFPVDIYCGYSRELTYG